MSLVTFHRPLDEIEHLFDPGSMGQLAAPADLEVIRRLQGHIDSLQAADSGRPLPTHPDLAPVMTLRTGAAYQVDSATLALALQAPLSGAGSWTAVIGMPDYGIEAAEEAGVDLSRTVLVPDPGADWLEATAMLVDVVTLVLLRPPRGVSASATGRIGARLRKRAGALVSWGEWPGAELRLSVHDSVWSGVERGHGRLLGRRLTVAATRGAAPVRYTELVPGGHRVDRLAPAAELAAPLRAQVG